MNPNKYIVVVEIDDKGYIFRLINKEEDALEFRERVLNISRNYSYPEIYAKINALNPVASYNINGNQLYFGNFKSNISNGVYSVYLLKINEKTFCLQSFIKEREYNSTVFELEDLTDEFVEKFPHLCMIAN